jgi:hypothetical protein
LLYFDVLPGFFLPEFFEGGVVIRVKLARGIIRNVQEFYRHFSAFSIEIWAASVGVESVLASAPRLVPAFRLNNRKSARTIKTRDIPVI